MESKTCLVYFLSQFSTDVSEIWYSLKVFQSENLYTIFVCFVFFKIIHFSKGHNWCFNDHVQETHTGLCLDCTSQFLSKLFWCLAITVLCSFISSLMIFSFIQSHKSTNKMKFQCLLSCKLLNCSGWSVINCLDMFPLVNHILTLFCIFNVQEYDITWIILVKKEKF